MVPDWGTIGGATIVTVSGSFSVEQGYAVQSCDIVVYSAGTPVPPIPAISFTDSEVVFSLSPLAFGDTCFAIRMTVATQAGASPFEVATPTQLCFQAHPEVSALTDVSVFNGPPSGGTRVTFKFSMVPDQAMELDCAFGTVRSPVSFSLPANPADPVSGSCESPLRGDDQFVCVQLVPSTGTYLPFPSVQDVTGSNCDAVNSFIFNYYEQMPLLASLSLATAPYVGGTTVEVTGFNFPTPRASAGIICRFGSSSAGEVSGTRTSTSVVTCDPAPALASTTGAVGADHHARVPLSLSFNDGENFSVSTLDFVYVPVATIASLSPSVGLRNGGTVVTIKVAYTSPVISGLPVTGPLGICVNSYMVFLDSISPDLSEITVTMPSLVAATGAFSADPVAVNLYLIQEDGACGLQAAGFTYRKEWAATLVAPAVITDSATMSVQVTGTSFFASADALCKATAIWPVGSGIDEALGGETCEATGALTVASATSAACHIDLASTLHDCAYEAASGVSGESLLWEALTLNLAVSMNGIDFAPVVRASDGLEQPVLAVRAPVARTLSPSFGFDFGGYPVEVRLETGVAWQVSKCEFASGARTVLVSAARYSLRSVLCSAPRWLLPAGAAAETVAVRILVSGDVFSNSLAFRMIGAPEVMIFGPQEGPKQGGTKLTVVGTGFGLLSGVQCVIGGSRVVRGTIVSGEVIECVTPAVAGTGPTTLELAVNWQTDARLAQATVLTALFTYTDSAIAISAISLLSGPTTGGSAVLLTLTNPVANTGLLRCIFGRLSVVPERKSDTEYVCASPAVPEPTTANLRFSLDAQTKLDFFFTNPVGAAAAGSTGAAEFEYYWPASVGSTVPAYAGAVGGTELLIRGAHFRNTPTLSCKIDDRIVLADLFISTQLIVCTTPGGSLGVVPISVANNGVDFTTAAANVFSYTEAQPVLVMAPFLGPVTGGTRVTFKPASGTLPAASLASVEGIRCQFGVGSVQAVAVNAAAGELTCVAPPAPGNAAGSQPVMVFFNGLDSAHVTREFLYHDPPRVDALDPLMGPQGLPNTVTITGASFVNSEYLTVRFGAASVGYADVRGLWISGTEIRCTPPLFSPASTLLRVPVMVSNNGQDFVPAALATWDPDDDSFDTLGVVRYYTFHVPVVLRSATPAAADFRGGGFVSVHGGPFLETPGLACGFDRVVADAVAPIFLSATQILCPVPNMWTSQAAVSSRVKLQVSLVTNRWTDSFVEFEFTFGAEPGQYEPHRSDTEWVARSVACEPGYMCEPAGLSEPLPCPPGTYQPHSGQLQCLPCARGYYCPHARMTVPAVCPGGWVCDEENLVVAYKPCPAGFVCLSGTATLDPLPDEPYTGLAPSCTAAGLNAPYRCLQGMYCLEGTAGLVSILGNFSTPQPCFMGAYCGPGSGSPFGAGAAPLGRYSPVPKIPALLCPPRHFCGPVTGRVEPSPCPAGTYNGLYGAHNCTLAYEGSVAPAPFMAAPLQSDCGYVAGRKGIITLQEDDLCPPAMVCGFGVGGDAEPLICVPATSATDCDAAAGQVFVAAGVGRTRLADNQAHCCWNNAAVMTLARRVENIFSAMPAGAGLEERAARRFRQALDKRHAVLLAASPTGQGFTGYHLLEQVTRLTLVTTFDVKVTRVRERILFEIERRFTFKPPDPCAPGVYCYRGTCAGLAAIESAGVQR